MLPAVEQHKPISPAEGVENLRCLPPWTGEREVSKCITLLNVAGRSLYYGRRNRISLVCGLGGEPSLHLRDGHAGERLKFDN